MNQSKYLKYLNRKHEYPDNTCITLITDIYKTELNSNSFDGLWDHLKLPEGKHFYGSSWIRHISIDSIEKWASINAKKVDLTAIQEYDVIIFKSGRLLPTHFGMYVGANKFIHLEETKYSRIESLNEKWRSVIASIWRDPGINI